MDIQKIKTQLIEKIGSEFVIENAPMNEYTSFKTGGPADLLVIPQNVEDLKAALKELGESDVPFMLLGNGSNTIFRDGGYRGVVIHIGDAMSSVVQEGTKLICGSGAFLSIIAKAAEAASLTGFEFASGIPGSVGGAIFMNAGAYGGEMKDIVETVKVVSRDGNTEKIYKVDELNLGYRSSILQETNEIVVEVTFNLKEGDREEIRQQMRELQTRRNEKQPVNYPSAGSFFKRPEGYFAGKLVQDAGLKGVSVGGAQVSQLHSGFLINTGGATTTDILQLKDLIQAKVMDQFGVMLETEVRIVGED